MSERIHATAVAIAGRAVLLIGPSGSGKSDLALRLIDRGATLVGDDYVELFDVQDAPHVRPASTIAGRIEVRGLGIVDRPHAPEAPVALVVDLAAAPERMPEPAVSTIGGFDIATISLRPFEASAPIKVEVALRRAALALEAAPR